MRQLAQEGREKGYRGLDFPMQATILQQMYPGESVFDDHISYQLGDPVVSWGDRSDEEENV
jgi:hypothetical protein